MSPYWLGFMVGAVSAVIGALVEFLIARRRDPDTDRLPGCMIMMTGALGMTGIGAVGVSLFTDQIGPTLLMGLGVGSGFLTGFLLMVLLWFLFMRQ
ncbi:MAG: hypothetical protein H6662_12735 [Ardenticatenaceae bacterium]|nr:hypothetical protein [Anaerolineales bacterium]MCB8922444.1 hypothetical protein [Ardenticatenaceae bacterium]MCB8989912.1 hypothetical protein [Ardenticatenaceae bacterium]